MRSSLLVIFLFLLLDAPAQKLTDEYLQLTGQADVFFQQKEYAKAIDLYRQAEAANGGLARVRDRYRAASCWALTGNADSSFKQLERIVYKGKFKDIELLAGDLNFSSLQTDPRWKRILEAARRNGED